MATKNLAKLDSSTLDRKNILNNPFAIEHIQKEVGIIGLMFEGEYKFTAEQVANFFEVDLKTIKRYTSKFNEELSQSGYEVLTGQRLSSFKELDVRDMHVPKLGIFTFKALLNIGMLLQESEKARLLRGLILNIVLDVVSKKAGGSTKYINQRDEDYLISLYIGENYRKEFVESIKRYVDMGNIKYVFYTNKIYQSIFKEKSQEYKNILDLNKKDNVRDTMYSEVLTVIASYETGLAHEIRKHSDKLKRKLTEEETDLIFAEFEKNPLWEPQIKTVRIKMSSRDNALRGVIHPELSDYVQPLNTSEFERFLGEKSKELMKRIEEKKEVFKRLRNK